MRNLLAIATVFFLCVGCSTLERAPGPEHPELALQTEGSLLFLPSTMGGQVNRTIVLIDLPTLERREVHMEKSNTSCSSVDDQGRLVYLVDGERHRGLHKYVEALTSVEAERLPPSERWSLRLLNMVNGDDSTLLPLDSGPWWPEIAPRGGRVVLWRTSAGTGAANGVVRILDLQSLGLQQIDAEVGAILAVDWLPDGESFAVSGKEGGVILSAASGAVLERDKWGYGPFSPDGSAFLAIRDDAQALVERKTGRLLASPARIPWPAVRGGPALEDGESQPIGMCGPRLLLYPALPTKGTKISRSYAVGGVMVFENQVIKVCDVVTGEFATVWRGDEAGCSAEFSPVRLPAMAR